MMARTRWVDAVAEVFWVLAFLAAEALTGQAVCS